MNYTIGLSRRGEYPEPVEAELDALVSPIQALLSRLNAAVSDMGASGAVFTAPCYGPVGVIVNTGSRQLTAAESGSVVTNSGDTDGSTVYLPSASAGLTFTFCLVASQTMTIRTASGDTLRIIGSTGTALEASSAGDSATLVAVDTQRWITTAYTGVWSAS